MFQTPEALAETALRQMMRTESVAMTPDEQMVGFQDGGVRGYDKGAAHKPNPLWPFPVTVPVKPASSIDEMNQRLAGVLGPTPPRSVMQYPGIEALGGNFNGAAYERFLKERKTDPFGQTPVDREMFDRIVTGRNNDWLTEDRTGQDLYRVAPELAAAGRSGSMSASGGLGDFAMPQYRAPKMAAFDGSQYKPEELKTDPLVSPNLDEADAAGRAKREDGIQKMLDPYQKRADMLDADAREMERNSKWDAIINAGINLAMGGAPSDDPKSANFMGLAAGALGTYVQSVKGDKEKIRELKQQAAQVTAEMASLGYTAREQAGAAGVNMAIGQAAGDNAVRADANRTAGLNWEAGNNYNNTMAGIMNQRGLAQFQGDVMGAGYRYNGEVDLAQSRISAQAALDKARASGVAMDWDKINDEAIKYANGAQPQDGTNSDPAAYSEAYQLAKTQSVYNRLVQPYMMQGMSQQDAWNDAQVIAAEYGSVKQTDNGSGTVTNRYDYAQNDRGSGRRLTQIPSQFGN